MAEEQVTQTEEPFNKADPALNPRNQAFNEIAKRANERQNANASEPMPPKDGEGAPQDAAEEPELSPEEAARQADAASEAEDKAQAQPVAPAAPVAAPSEPTAPAIDPNAEYDLTVDGKPVKVKGSQIIKAGFATMQKETAADYRLQMATKMLEEAKNTAGRIIPQNGQLPQGAVQAAQPDDLQLAELIQFGTKEQAAEAIKALRSRGPSAEQIVQQVPQIVNAQMAFQRGAEFAKTEYADLLADPYLRDMFLMREEQARRGGDQRQPADLYKEIGEGIRTHFQKPKPGTPTPVKTMEDRKTAKANAPAVPRLASSRMSGGDAQPKAKTREQIIEEMRKARGQTSLNRTH